MKTCKKQNECTSYPFCYGCEAWCGTNQELQEEINNFFKGRPYRVQLDAPSFDEFEETLYNFVKTCGGNFHDCNTKEVETRIKETAKQLKNIQAREGNETGTVAKESLENVVDLGLPSGTLWAKCNLGAEKESDFGLFYSWGDTKGYNADKGHLFNWNTCKHGTSWDNMDKYNKNDGKLVLDNEDDPAYVATDGKMKSPSEEQLQELIDYTNHEWTRVDGVNGMKFINRNDDTKYIFIPAAGCCYDPYHNGVGSWGYVWSSSRNSGYPYGAWRMSFDSGNVIVYSACRCLGYSVRGVAAPQTEAFDEIDDTDDGQPVDLGLPSGTLWSKTNLGAKKETDFGLFYQWGDAKGDDGDANNNFSWDMYKWGVFDNLSKYNKSDDKATLDNEDDPVYAATGGQMMSPTKQQLHELIDYTNHESVEIDGVKGMKFVNKSDDTKYIFIPAAGYCYGSYHDTTGSWGYVWSSTRGSSFPFGAWLMGFDSENVSMLNYGRCYGFSVRGVVVPKNKEEESYNEESYDKIDDTDDGHPVDLGLPSGTLWQKSNLGASKPSDFGKFYSWGDIEGCDGEEGHNFSWDTYKWGAFDNLSKYDYSSGETNLHDEDDPVYAATGGQYKSPTKDQLQELIDNTEHRWVRLENGVNGMKFINKNDDTKYIFIPAAGYCDGSNRDVVGSWGYVWSSSRYASDPYSAWGMTFDSGCVYIFNINRYDGFSVRGVINK